MIPAARVVLLLLIRRGGERGRRQGRACRHPAVSAAAFGSVGLRLRRLAKAGLPVRNARRGGLRRRVRIDRAAACRRDWAAARPARRSAHSSASFDWRWRRRSAVRICWRRVAPEFADARFSARALAVCFSRSDTLGIRFAAMSLSDLSIVAHDSSRVGVELSFFVACSTRLRPGVREAVDPRGVRVFRGRLLRDATAILRTVEFRGAPARAAPCWSGEAAARARSFRAPPRATCRIARSATARDRSCRARAGRTTPNARAARPGR